MGFIYKIVEKEHINNSYNFTVKIEDRAHPVFQAHFPDYPLLPGYMQLEIASELLNLQIKKIDYAKFSNQIFPNDVIQFNIEKKDDKFKVKTTKDSKKCAEFTIE